MAKNTNTPTDEFFGSMIDAAELKAKQRVSKTMSTLRAELAQTKKELSTYKRGAAATQTKLNASLKTATKQVAALDKREKAMVAREKEVKLATEEIEHLMKGFDAIKDSKVETKTTTTTIKRLVPGSKGRTVKNSWGCGRTSWHTWAASSKALALSRLRKRIKASDKTKK